MREEDVRLCDEDEFRYNPYGRCPKCNGDRIDQVSSEDRGTIEWWHCYDCGTWYNEEGEIEGDLDER